MNSASVNPPMLNTMSPGTRSQTRVSMTVLCTISGDRAYQKLWVML